MTITSSKQNSCISCGYDEISDTIVANRSDIQEDHRKSDVSFRSNYSMDQKASGQTMISINRILSVSMPPCSFDLIHDICRY